MFLTLCTLNKLYENNERMKQTYIFILFASFQQYPTFFSSSSVLSYFPHKRISYKIKLILYFDINNNPN